MGFLSRSGSSASSRKPSYNVPSLSPSNLHRRAGLQASAQNVSTEQIAPKFQNTRPLTSASGHVIAPEPGNVNAAPTAPVGPPIPARTSSKQATVSDSLAKTLAKRGKQLKTSASKLSLVSNISHSSLWSANSRNHDKSPTKSPNKGSQTPLSHSTSSSISAPTHFQHLTHAIPEQFTKLAAAKHGDLVADFSAIRASQTPRRDLRGIQAVDLHSRNSSAETNTSSIVSTEGSTSTSSATASIASETSWNSQTSLDKGSPKSQTHRRAQRSQDSFSQPFRNGHSPQIGAGSPLAPPPRISSRNAPVISESVDVNRSNGMEIDEDERRTVVAGDLDENTNSTFQRLSVSKNFSSSVLGDNGLGLVEEGELLIQSAQQPQVSQDSEGHMGHLKSQVPPPRSSSSDSNLTVTPLNYEVEAETKSKSQIPIPKTLAKKHVATTSSKGMQRSSLTNGLFTSWSFEEEPSVPKLKHSQARYPEHRPAKRIAAEHTVQTKLPVPSFSPNSNMAVSGVSIQIPSRNASIQHAASRLPTRRSSAAQHHHHHQHQSDSSAPLAVQPNNRHRRASKSSPAVY